VVLRVRRLTRKGGQGEPAVVISGDPAAASLDGSSSSNVGGGHVLDPIGYVESPILDRQGAPRQPDEGAPGAVLVLDPRLLPALAGLAVGDRIVVLTWLHRARRDVLQTHPRDDIDRPEQGVFSTRSPERPNPIGLHDTTIVGVERTRIVVDHLEVLDGTPVIDIKPALMPLEQR
jgi:tRNA-Thr(GGU) m(6)t(6)A37 methyltransferase TsaA